MTTPIRVPDSDPPFNLHAAIGTSDGLDGVWQATRDEIARHGYEIKPLVGATSPMLGSGGFATVVYAEHTQTHAPVAVKVFVDPKKEHVVQSFERERKTLEAPAFPRQFAAFARTSWHAPNAQPFIVLDFLSGKPITEYAQEQKLSSARRVELVEELLSGVQGCHAVNLMHRDIKPGNVHVHVDDRGRASVKLLDYGLAGEIAKVSGATTVAALGTELYSPPEVNRGDRRADAKDDIYNCATTALHLFADSLPPPNDTRAGDPVHLARCRNLLREKGCDRKLRAIILKGLDAPERRFSTPQAMAEALEDWRVGVPRRRRRLWTVGAAAAVLAIVVGVLWSRLVETRRELQLREWVALKGQTAHLAFAGHAAVSKLLVEAQGLETEWDRQRDAGSSAAAATLGQAMDRLRQAVRVSDGLARTQPRREALGIPLNEFPWVLAAPAIARRKQQLDERYNQISQLLASGQIDEADRFLDELQRDLAQLCKDNVKADQAAAAQIAYDALKDAASQRLRTLDGFQTIDQLAANARADWQAGNSDQATRGFGQARQNLEAWIAKNETAEEKVAREKSNQLALEALQREKQQIQGQLNALAADLDQRDKQIREQQAQITKLNAERLEDRDASSQRVTALQGDLAKMKTERDARQVRVDQLTAHETDLNNQLAAARDETKKSERAAKAARTQLETEKKRADNLQAALTAASAGGGGDSVRQAAALAELKTQIEQVDLADWRQARDVLVAAATKYREVEEEKKRKLVDFKPESPTIAAIDARLAEHRRLIGEALKKQDLADGRVFDQLQEQLNRQQALLKRLTEVDKLRDTAPAVRHVHAEISLLVDQQAPYKAGAERAARKGPAVDPLEVAKTLPPVGKPGEIMVNSIGMKLVYVPPGEFQMGAPEGESDALAAEKPQHPVRISNGYFMGVYEVTQAESQAVMGTNPSYFSRSGGGKDKVGSADTSRFPVEQASYQYAVTFCRILSEKMDELRFGRIYRLPTEAEWEYACRAGTKTPFHFGASANGTQVNVNGTNPYGGTAKGPYLARTTTVGSYPGNAFGLYDMHGNVNEWCEDVWHDNYAGAAADGSAWTVGGNGTMRVLRGGCWLGIPRDARSAFRIRFTPDGRSNEIGFRVVCVVSGVRTQ